MQKNHIIRNPFNSDGWALVVEVMKMRKTSIFMAVIFGYSAAANSYYISSSIDFAVSSFIFFTFVAPPFFLFGATTTAIRFKRFDLKFAILNWVLLSFSALTILQMLLI